MATPYLGLNIDAASESKFDLDAVNLNATKIEAELYRKRADLPDRVQIGSDWFTLNNPFGEWEIYTDDISGNKVIRHGRWAMVEIQFKAKKTFTIGSSGNVTNSLIATVDKGYRPANRVSLDAVNSNLNMNIELNTAGNCYVTAYNHTSTTIAKDTVIRVAGRYVYVP